MSYHNALRSEPKVRVTHTARASARRHPTHESYAYHLIMKEKVTRNMCILKSILEVFPGTSYRIRHGKLLGLVPRSRIRVVCGNLHPRLFFFGSVPLEFGRAAAKRSDRWIRAPGAPEARFGRMFWPVSTGRSVVSGAFCFSSTEWTRRVKTTSQQ